MKTLPHEIRGASPELSRKIPELLAPVGNFETFMAALDAGADAIYLGLKKFSARARAENFTLADLELMTGFAQRRGVKVFVALNTLIRNDELSEIYRTLAALSRSGVDAVIVQDLGLTQILRRDFPEIPIHLSTQLAIHNAAGVERMAGLGCRRVVLGRELTLAEIGQIAATTAIELECFVFGALCLSVAGLCQFSSFYGGQSANRGRCAQPCRRLYRHGGKEDYLLSPSDFNALDFLPELVRLGIASCKIEGRMKGSQYVRVAVGVFRRALDEIKAEGELSPARCRGLHAELVEAYARPTTTANLSGRYSTTIIEPGRVASNGVVLGKLRRAQPEPGSGSGMRVRLRTARQLESGDRLKIISPGRDGRDNSFTLRQAPCLEQKGVREGARMLSLTVPFACRVGDLLVKVGSRDQYGRRGGAWYRQQLVAERGPEPVQAQARSFAARLPAWLSEDRAEKDEVAARAPAAHSAPSWLIKLADWTGAQAFLRRPGRRVALELNGRVWAAIAGRERECFRRYPELEWSLPPLAYPGREAELRANLSRLVRAGFRRFHLNGLDQLEAFSALTSSRDDFCLATGPFLHAANQAAIDFYAEQGFSLVHLTAELDEKSLRSLKPAPGVGLAQSVFAFIPLLLTRIPLPLERRERKFFSRRREEILAVSRDGLTVLVAGAPFSLLNLAESRLNSSLSLKIIDLTWAPADFDLSRFHKPHRFHLDDLSLTSYNFPLEWQ
ncbi:MAG TPA: U32 family peptidase [Proteobacteria bacterium]|nr:U32 family peptidase [Pseudomonadota bacterium]